MGASIQNRQNTDFSGVGVWAFCTGTGIGWSTLVATSNIYLDKAGSWGSVLGVILGTLYILLVCRNYAYLIQIYPKLGGTYSFCREIFGNDCGYLTGWFLSLIYFVMLWAGATSMPMLVNTFTGDALKFWQLYSVFGHEVYLGEALFSIICIVAAALLSLRGLKVCVTAMISLTILFTVGLLVCFLASTGGIDRSLEPAFIPDSGVFGQIISVAFVAPWAFVGFESVSHASSEYSFPKQKIFKIMVIATVTISLLYISAILMSVTAYPERYSSWVEYIKDLGNLSGIESLPAFYAVHHYLGNAGLGLLLLSQFCIVFTTLIGTFFALSRIFYSASRNQVLPSCFTDLNSRKVPMNAIRFIAVVSILIPFLGRTAMEWIIDVMNIGAIIVYGMVSAATLKKAEERGDIIEKVTGALSLAVMMWLGMYLILPDLFYIGSMNKETYLVFMIWSILGFLYFHYVLRHDRENIFGSTHFAWVALLSFALLIDMVWMWQNILSHNNIIFQQIDDYLKEFAGKGNVSSFIKDKINGLENNGTRSVALAIAMFITAFVIMMVNHIYMTARSRHSNMMAHTDPVSGAMSKKAYIKREAKLDQSLQDGALGAFSLAVFNICNMKKILASLGRKAGDEYVRNACLMLSSIFKHSTIYRVNSDVFVLILVGSDYNERKNLMSRIYSRSVTHIKNGGVVVAGGLSDYVPNVDVSVNEVFIRANDMMYENKKLLAGLLNDDDADADAENKRDSELAAISIKKYILIVDDELINRKILGNMLQDSYELLYAEDGIEALKKIQQYSEVIAMVLLDLQLPKMSGIDVLRKMTNNSEYSRIPVIVLTAEQGTEVECLNLGAVDYLQKPYPAKEIILARITKCIELYEDRDTIKNTERDSITGLYNFEYFKRYVRMFDKHYEDYSMDALVVDINHFHMINERHGRKYGDGVLKIVGSKIREYSGEISAVCCRKESDVFLLYCQHQDSYSEFFEKISVMNGAANLTAGRVWLRMGIYPNVDRNLEVEQRFDRAIMAANSVKNGFLNFIGVYNAEMHQTVVNKERLLEDFHKSIDNRDFKVFYQPKFDIRFDNPILYSAEALVRWIHPEMGMISPVVFIPLLEECGLIIELDKYVWREVGAQIRAWKNEFGYSVPVSVNVSRIDMLTPNLKGIFMDILRDNKLSTDDLVLEITESAYADDSVQVVSTAKDLRDDGRGFRIEMDDFGSGYSSLGMLTNISIDALKLDMSLVRNAFANQKKDVRLLEIILEIAEYLNLSVIAEGVETEDQMLSLKAMGCEYVQGYYFSKPVPAEEFNRFLTERRGRHVEIVPAFKKDYEALGSDVQNGLKNIYYIDMVSCRYIELAVDNSGGYAVSREGEDFFVDVESLFLAKITDGKQREKVKKALDREALLQDSRTGIQMFVDFQMLEKGHSTACLMFSLSVKKREDYHMAVCLSSKDAG